MAFVITLNHSYFNNSKTKSLREKHLKFLKMHPFNEQIKLNKIERKKLGILAFRFSSTY